MPKFIIATWNVNSLRVRLPHVLTWLARVKPDVLALQETKLPDADFPIDAIHEAGYEVVFSGQKTYNGVAILSRNKATDIITDLPELGDHQRRVLAAVIGDIRVLDVYIPNGERVVIYSPQAIFSLANVPFPLMLDVLTSTLLVSISILVKFCTHYPFYPF